MAMAGATVVDAREGQQITGLLGLPVWIPYMLMWAIMQNPNSPLSITLSLLPMTAPLTMLIRDGIHHPAGLANRAGVAWSRFSARWEPSGWQDEPSAWACCVTGSGLSWREIFARQAGGAQ